MTEQQQAAMQAALEALSDFVSLANLAAHNGRPVHLVREEPIMRHAEETCAALRAALAQPDRNPWRDAVEDELSVCHMVASDDPKESIKQSQLAGKKSRDEGMT